MRAPLRHDSGEQTPTAGYLPGDTSHRTNYSRKMDAIPMTAKPHTFLDAEVQFQFPTPARAKNVVMLRRVPLGVWCITRIRW